MMELVTAAEMRDLDRLTIELGTPGHVLMERAGTGACAMLLRLFPGLTKKGVRVVVLAGKGNNGGDGFVIARLLRKRGVRVGVWLFGSAADVAGDARRNLEAYRSGRGDRASLFEIEDSADLAGLEKELAAASCIVDAMLGTGLGSEVRGIYAAAIELVNAAAAPVFAVDIPSGLDADSGRPRGVAVRAAATATFGYAKYGQVIHPGLEHCGALEVVDIGIAGAAVEQAPPHGALLEAADVRALLPRRAVDSHKGVAGHLLVIACLLYTSPSPRDRTRSRMPSSA